MSSTPGGQGLRYAPGLDGVRALAVLAVVFYHIGTTSDLRALPGGYLGVDVFFVLSGYLITSLLLVEAGETGRISIKKFYIRRARRLLPALFALLVAVAAIGAFWLPQQAARLRGDLLASLFYVQNWWLVIQSSSYFASVGDRPPMLTHLWSLAVEEQYYLIWPLVLIALVKLRARRRAMLAVVLVGVVASTVVGQLLYEPFADPSRVYYGTDTRALAPLLGAALAIAIQPWRHSPRLPLAIAVAVDSLGLVALAGLVSVAALLHDTDELLYRGGFVAIAGLAAILVAVAGHPATLLGRALGSQPLRYLGERSYAIYLWHWPVCLVTRPEYDIPVTGWANAALRVAISIVLAEISYQLIEKPIRRHGFIAALRLPVSAGRPLTPVLRTVGLSVALVAGATVGGFGLTTAAGRSAAPVALGSQSPQPSPTAVPRPRPGLPLGARVEFFGDSRGTSLLKDEVRPPDLPNYIDAVDATTPGCGILANKIILQEGTRHDLSGCVTQMEHWTTRVTEDKPDLSLIIIGVWEMFDIVEDDGTVVGFGSPAWDAIFKQRLTEGVGILLEPGTPVGLVLTTCQRPFDPDHWYERVGDGRGRHINDLMEEVADSFDAGVYIVDPPAEFCTEPIASDPTYRTDGVHYQPKGAALFFQTILPQLLSPASPQTSASRSPSPSANPSAHTSTSGVSGS